MRERNDFYTQLSYELNSAGLMTAAVSGTGTAGALMDRLTSGLGRQLVQFISPPP
jgi:hypothetical protein